ncbi:Calx-beta domain-containing protein [Desertivirga xinjiangensis]|uniref:Calx-beta domain-containing protein n=1 Tax=Desertivirga xinjiangensis TaxID=539206 RepID=UPI00210B2A4E|nr:Calx-beta domain-containing protein [Pedobacter xinjiangensis]
MISRLLPKYLLFFLFFLGYSSSVLAEGGKELHANGGTDVRLASSSFTGVFDTEGLIRVYVKSGETIYLGSSGVNNNASNHEIYLISPSGISYGNGDKGFIANKGQETNGPVGTTDSGFDPFTTPANETGIWSVFFTGSPRYFDVSVSAKNASDNPALADFIKGRAYMNVFGGDLGDYEDTFNGIFYVLTNDGYTYKVDANGLAGYQFVFFSNNKGYKTAGNDASYRSQNNTSTTNLHDPRKADVFNANGTAEDVTHKLFFNSPAADLPSKADIYTRAAGYADHNDNGAKSETWLKVTPTLPVINNFTFTGREGSADKAGTSPLGGYIGFESNQAGTYSITIELGAFDVTLTGEAVQGVNKVFWDGLNSAGVAVKGTLASSAITVGLKAGEVHFPYIDVENNPSGIKITRQGGGLATTTVYWNDSNINGGTSNLTGADSGNGAHRWGSTQYDDNAFGDNRGLDTWAYLLSNIITPSANIQLREADLQVVSLAANKTNYCVGETVTYTGTIKNNGPDAVTGAKIAFNYPAELTITGVGYVNSTGVSIVADPPTGSQITGIADITNQGTITATITGIINAKPAGTLDVSATILRPADVTDPDATNIDINPPTDPQVECDAGTAGCNNIRLSSINVIQRDINITGTASVNEGSTAAATTDMTFTVTLSAANAGCDVSVKYDIINGTTSDSDFAAGLVKSGTLVFTPGQISKTITVPVKHDKMVEANETFSIKLSNATSGGIIVNSTATGTITNDDATPGMTVTATDGKEGVNDGRFTFTFSGGASFDVDTDISFTLGGTGSTALANGTDYTSSVTSNTITIPAGQNSVTIDLAVANDLLAEGDEVVTLAVNPVSNTYGNISITNLIPVLKITDNDYATLTINNPTITEGDTGTQDLVFSVTLNNPTGTGFNISYATQDGTATAADDFISAGSASLTFGGAAGTQAITIPVKGDRKIEANETFSVLLSGLTNSFGGHLTFNITGTGTILDNDNTPANKKISITAADGKELGPVSGVFTFSFDNGASTDEDTKINFALDAAGTAIAGLDFFDSAVTSVTIPAGQNSTTLSFDVLGDNILEDAETIILNTGVVSNSKYNGITVENTKSLNIIDDDFANIIVSNVSKSEGDNGTTNLEFNVQLDRPTGSDFTIGYTLTDGTAKAGEDYQMPATNTLTFTGAAETQKIVVKVNGDMKIEGDETLTLTLGAPSKTFGGHITVNGSPATGTILDDDRNDPAKKVITVAAAPGYEGVANSKASFSFSLPAGVTVDSDTEIAYTLPPSGSATGNGVDYSGAVSGTITITRGDNSANLDLPVVDDLLLEGDETVDLTVTSLNNPAYTGFAIAPASQLQTSIVENDNTVLISSPSQVLEGDNGTKYIRFNVSVDLATSGPFNVTYATSNGTAVAGEDYEAKSGSLAFTGGLAGENHEIDVIINGDLKIEQDETFVISLTGLSNDFGGTLKLSAPVTMTIKDDDNTPENKLIRISKTNGSEDGTDGVFTVSFPAGVTADKATTVFYSLTGLAQGTGTDYTNTAPTPGQIVILPNENSRSFNLDINDDIIIEGTEEVLMTITSVQNPVYSAMAGDSPVSLDILDNDNTEVNNTITLSKVRDGAEGGTNPQFLVSFPAGLTASVPTEVTYSVVGTALNGVDYTTLTGKVTILANQNSALIDVSLINDQIIESIENVQLSLTGATNTISTLKVISTPVSVTITDDDNVAINKILTLSKIKDAAEPGTDAEFRVSFPGGITSSADTRVFYSVNGGTAQPGTDYQAPAGEIFIPAGQNSATFNVDVFDDKIIENVESVQLKLTSASSTILALTVGTAVESASIQDDDNIPGNNKITLSWVKDASEPAANGQLLVSYPAGITSSEDTKVDYNIGGSATNSVDFTSLTGSLILPANTNSLPLNITVADDKIIEPAEKVEITLTAADNLSFNTSVDGTPKAVNILDDDNNVANNRIILKWLADGTEPGTPAQFSVGFPVGYTSSKPTKVKYTVAGTATSGIDFTALSGEVTIPATTSTAPVIVNVLNDSLIEGTETITLTLTGAENTDIPTLTILPLTAVSANIEDEDDDVASNNILSLSGSDGSEPGNNGSFTLSYPAGYSSSSPTVVSYTIAGTALRDIDYTALSGTVTIPANTPSANIQVPVLDDKIIEQPETVEIRITSASNGVSSLTWSPATETIEIDDDDNNLANNTIVISKVADASEPATNAQFKVSFPDGYISSEATVVTYKAAGTAQHGTDYSIPGINNATLTGTVTIPANTGSALIDAEVIDDKVIEPTEKIELSLTGASNPIATMAIIPNGSPAIADISDDDNAEENKYIALTLVRDGAEGSLNPQFQVSFPGGFSSSEPTTVNYQLVPGSASATPGMDYTQPSGSVVIAPYANSALIDISLINDMILEPRETVELALLNANNSIAPGLVTQTDAVIAGINDDDNIADNNKISLSPVSSGSEPGTPAQLKVSFPAGYMASVPTTVNYAVSGGTAINGTDYTVTGQVVIPANSGSANFPVTVIDDQIVENTETVQLKLSNAENSIFPTIGVSAAAESVDINDNDNTPANRQITISKADGSEDGDIASFKFSLSPGVTFNEDIVIPFGLAGAAVNGADFNASVSTSIKILAGESSASLSLDVIDDNSIEDTETIILAPGVINSTYGTFTVDPASVLVANILDNDKAILTLSAPVTIAEGDNGTTSVTYTLTLNNATQGGFDVNYKTLDGSAVAGEDYIAASSSIHFAGNANESHQFTILINGDKLIEGDENFTLELDSPNPDFNDRLIVSNPASLITIKNDDQANIRIFPAKGSEENSVAGSFRFEFENGVSSDKPTTIHFGLRGSASGADYTGGVASVTIPAGEKSYTLELPVIDDNIAEGTETVILTTGAINSPYGVTMVNSPQSLEITDNDEATLSISDATVTEGQSGTTTISFNVTLDRATGKPFTVNYSTADDSARVADNDFIALSDTLNFSGTQPETKTIKITVRGDRKVEGDESFNLSLNGHTFNNTLSIPVGGASATGVIQNDDSAVIRITSVDGSETGPSAASFLFSFPQGVTVNEDTKIEYSLSGVAQNGQDYTGSLTGTIIIPANTDSVRLTLPVVADQVAEDTESLIITTGAVTSNYGVSVDNPTVSLNIYDKDQAMLTLSGPESVTESNGLQEVQFIVTLDKATAGSFKVNYRTVDGTAKTGDNDYVSNAGQLEFAGTAGERDTITVRINGDYKIEKDENFKLELTGLTQNFNNRLVISVPSLIVKIQNDDQANITILPEQDGAEEGSSPGRFRFKFDGDVVSDTVTTVHFGLTGQAIAGTDYTGNPGTIAIPAGQNSYPLELPVTDDDIAEGTETVILTTGAVDSPYGITVSNSPQSLNITDNDKATLRISDASVTEGDSGTSTISFDVSLDKAIGAPLTVNYSITDILTTAGEDYIAPTGTLVFDGLNPQTKTIDITVKGDYKVERDETFTVNLTGHNYNNTLSIPAGGDSATGTILNDDSALIEITKTDAKEAGEEAGSFIFSYTGNAFADKDVIINYDLTGTAKSGDDYTGSISGSITIPAGEKSRTLNIPVNDDAQVEDTETVILTSMGVTPVYGITIANSPVSLDIIDNDKATLSFSGPASLTEGDDSSKVVSFTVTLDKAVAGGFNLDFTTDDGSAKVGDNDYVSNTGQLHFTGDAGESKTIEVLINGDRKIEKDENFIVKLGSIPAALTGRLSIQGAGSLSALISNDDKGTIEIIPADGSEDGPLAGSYTFRFPNGISSDANTVIDFKLEGSAKNSDYTGGGITSVTIPAGDNSFKLELPVIDDNLAEGTEDVILTATGVGSPYAVAVNNSPKTLNITDNDKASLRISNATVTEGPNGNTTMTFNVTLDTATGDRFTVNYATADDSAIAGDNDYTAKTGLLEFDGSATTKTITIDIIGDHKVEEDESFTISLSNLSRNFGNNLSIPAGGASARGTILNDDFAELEITAADGQEAGARAGSFIIGFRGDVFVDKDVVVSYSLSGTAISGKDYTVSTTGTVTLFAGEKSRTLNIPVLDDQEVEDTETVILTTNGVSSGGYGIAVNNSPQSLNIIDNDKATLSLAGPATVTEGKDGESQTLNFVVTLDKAVAGGFDLDFTTQDGSAHSLDNDYVSNSGQLHFAGQAGETDTIKVVVIGDGRIEDPENFLVKLGSVPAALAGRLSIQGQSSLSVTISNDDFGIIKITPGSGSEDGPEAGSFRFDFENGVSSDKETIVRFKLDGSATSADYTGAGITSVTIPPGAKTHLLELPVIDDDIAEDTEDVRLTVTAVDSHYINHISVANSPQSFSITDNDKATLRIADATVTEGQSGITTISFNVTLDKATGKPFTVNYATADSSAMAGDDDYIAATGTLSFDGTKPETKAIEIIVKGDRKIEADEYFTIDLTGHNYNNTLSIPLDGASARGTIVNDDSAVIHITTRDGSETGPSDAVFTFRLPKGMSVNEPTSIKYSLSGVAQSGLDYTGSQSGTIILPANTDSVELRLPVIADQVAEYTESVIITADVVSSKTGLKIDNPTTGLNIYDKDQAMLSLSGPASVMEGTGGIREVNFIVTLDRATAGPFKVNYETFDGSASSANSADNDYVSNIGELYFAGKAGEKDTITVKINTDYKIESPETFGIRLTGLTENFDDRLMIAAPASHVVEILNDDLGVISITPGNGSENGPSPASFRFDFLNDVYSEASTVINFRLDGSAKGQDYTGAGITSVTIPAGMKTYILELPVIDDNIAEGTETIVLTAGTVGSPFSPHALTVDNSPHSLDITDNDKATLRIADAKVTEGEGTTTISFDVTLDKATGNPIVVNYSVTDVSTTASEDYIVPGGSLQFDGQNPETKQISITVKGDHMMEGDETFTVSLTGHNYNNTLSIPVGGASATGTILDDDLAEITITPADAKEGELAGSFVIGFRGDVVVKEDVVVNYSLGGTAVSGKDYTGTTSGSVIIRAGEKSEVVNLPVVDDQEVEDTETIILTSTGVTSNSRYNIPVTNSPASLNIIDNDKATLSLAGPATVTEGKDGSSQTLNFVVTLDKAVSGGFNIDYSTEDGSAQSGDNDYISNSGKLHFAGDAGETDTIKVTITGDGKIELDENFLVKLGSLPAVLGNRLVFQGPDELSILITNDDQGAIEIIPGNGSEDGPLAGSFTFKFPDGVKSDKETTISFNLGGTARNEDYTGAGITSIKIPAGDNQSVLTLPVLDDNIAEGTENVILTATGVSSPYTIAVDKSPKILNITDNDEATIRISNASVSEGHSGNTTISFNVSLDKATGTPFTVNYSTADGSAKVADNDYTALSDTLYFDGKQPLTQTINISVRGDRKVEENETFTVSLTGHSFNNTLSIPVGGASASGTILNDDLAEIRISSLDGSETGPSAASFLFRFPQGVTVSKETNITYTLSGAARGGLDYIGAQTGTVIIPANTDSVRLILPVIADQVAEYTESVVITASLPPGTNDVSIVNPTASLNIYDQDQAMLSLSGPASIIEGDDGIEKVQFIVTLDKATSGGFKVNYRTVDRSAKTADNDYVANIGQLEFAGTAGETDTITVVINGDRKIEDTEEFGLELTSLTEDFDDRLVIRGGALLVEIRNDDLGMVRITPASGSENGPASASFLFEFENGVSSDEDTKVEFQLSGTARDADYTRPVLSSVLIPAGATSYPVNLPVIDDNVAEGTETVILTTGTVESRHGVTVTNSPQSLEITDNDQATLSISDAAVTEGHSGTTTISFNVTLDKATGDGFTVSYSMADSTATIADNDYEIQTAPLYFDGTKPETKTISITVKGDHKIEKDERFTVSLDGHTYNNTLSIPVGSATAKGAILNDDLADIVITAADGKEDGAVAGSFVFSFSGDAFADKDVVVDYSLTGTAVSGKDYTGSTTGSVTILAGNKSVTLNVPVIDDQEVEDTETVILKSTGISTEYGIVVKDSSAILNIIDNDNAMLSFAGPATITEGADGNSQTLNFIVTLDKAVPGGFSIDYNTDDGSATSADNDYVSNSGQLHFAGQAGETDTIKVLVNGDRKIEKNENFLVKLGGVPAALADRLSIQGSGSLSVVITNDDQGDIEITPANGSENGPAAASFTFKFPDGVSSDEETVIDFKLEGSAQGTDYTGGGITSIAIPAGENSRELKLPVIDDAIAEGTETVILTATSIRSPYAITVNNAPKSLNIEDNDQATLSISDTTVTEGNSGNTEIRFNLTLDKATGKQFSVDYSSTDGTATVADNDYEAITGNISFDGLKAETKTILVKVKGDQKIETDEKFVLTIKNLVKPAETPLSIGQFQATGTILDDDNMLANNTITLSKLSDGAEPGTNATFRVSFPAGVTSIRPTTVEYGIGGTASNNADYIELSGLASIPAGENYADIIVEVTDDQLLEPVETIALTLTKASNNGFSVFALNPAMPVTATISDDDNAILRISRPSIKEGDNGTVTADFNVILSSATNAKFSVDYATKDGTATVADKDYEARNGFIEFTGTQVGETHTISVTVNGDKKIERDETFTLELSNLTESFGGRLVLSGSPSTATILDDDNIPANKKITVTRDDAAEGEYDGKFTFSFPAGVSSDVQTTIPFKLNGTAKGAGLDYQAMPSATVITIPAGETSASITIPVMDDAVIEETETVILVPETITNNRYNGITVNTPVPVLRIFDNDKGELKVSNPVIVEGNSGGTRVIFEVTSTLETRAAFTVDYTTSDGTATLSDKDYNFKKGTLAFNGETAGETKTIEVFINGDINIEGDETFNLELSNVSNTYGNTLAVNVYPGVCTILNDDNPPIAAEDIISTDEDVPVTHNIVNNDSDTDGTIDPGSLEVVTGAQYGTVIKHPDGTVTYTPKKDFNGVDNFTYTVKDNTGLVSDFTSVIIVVNAVNDAPVANDDELETEQDLAFSGNVGLNDADVDADHLSFTKLSEPANGSLVFASTGEFTYTPVRGFTGVDMFTYKVCDPYGECDEATVMIAVDATTIVHLTPELSTIAEGKKTTITAMLERPFKDDVVITFNYIGTAKGETDYRLSEDLHTMVIPQGSLTTSQKITVAAITDYVDEGEEDINISVKSVSSPLVKLGKTARVVIRDGVANLTEPENNDITIDPLVSPNGDGQGNEFFHIGNISSFPDNEVTIYNRWGNEVFRMKGYNDSDRVFRGYSNNKVLTNSGTSLVDGVYYYVIHTNVEARGIKVRKVNKGYLILKR